MDFDQFIHSTLLRGSQPPSAEIAFNLSALRLIAEPVYVSVWRSAKGSEGSIQRLTSHYYVQGKWVYFYVPEFYRILLLPDLYRSIRLPEAKHIAPSTKRRVIFNFDTDIDDFKRNVNIDDAISDWEPYDDGRNRSFDNCIRGASSNSHKRVKYQLRISKQAQTYLRLFADVVRKVVLFTEGRQNVLQDEECMFIRSICGVPITLRGGEYDGESM